MGGGAGSRIYRGAGSSSGSVDEAAGGGAAAAAADFDAAELKGDGHRFTR